VDRPVQPIRTRYSRVVRVPLVLAVGAALIGVVGAAAALLGASRASANPQAAARASVVTHVPTLEQQMLDAINVLRRSHGLRGLRMNANLATTARAHSLSMAEHGYFRHSSLGGGSFWSRVESKYGGPNWRVGENLVWASPHLSARQAIALWLSSPPHRRNLLAPVWREIGVGAVHADAAPGVYQGLPATILTADFGVRG
jgi:uncharacterized protein YkwD